MRNRYSVGPAAFASSRRHARATTEKANTVKMTQDKEWAMRESLIAAMRAAGPVAAVVIGMVLGSRWLAVPATPGHGMPAVHAVSANSDEAFAVCPAPIDGSTEGFFMPDFQTGDLSGGVLNQATGTFTAEVADHAAPESPSFQGFRVSKSIAGVVLRAVDRNVAGRHFPENPASIAALRDKVDFNVQLLMSTVRILRGVEDSAQLPLPDRTLPADG